MLQGDEFGGLEVWGCMVSVGLEGRVLSPSGRTGDDVEDEFVGEVSHGGRMGRAGCASAWRRRGGAGGLWVCSNGGCDAVISTMLRAGCSHNSDVSRVEGGRADD